MRQSTQRNPGFPHARRRPTFVLVPPPEESTGARCAACGATRRAGARFCADCGARAQTEGNFAVWLRARPSLPRRMQAELLDRAVLLGAAPIVALPMMLASFDYYCWLSVSLIFAWHLLRDCSPQRRSLGKWWRRLRVVTAAEERQCQLWQALARRVLPAVSQLAYTLAAAFILADLLGWERLQRSLGVPWPQWAASSHFVPLLLLLPLTYDLISLATILISPDARRVEDYCCGTQVVLEKAYARDRETCSKCGQLVAQPTIFCPNCGEPKALRIT